MISKTQTWSYTTFLALILVVIAGCLIIFFSSGGQPAGKDHLSWKKYVDNEHGFSLEVPSEWPTPKYWEVQTYEVQEGFIVQTQTLENCTNSSDYLKTEIDPFYSVEIEPLKNSRLDGFVLKDYHLDSITPGPEAYIFNCPYLIRLGLNSKDFPNPDTLFRHIVSSVKIWSPVKNSQL
jgi:hypothetical protein